MYKTIIYVISVLLSVFALTGINFNNLIKKGKKAEAIALVIVLSIALGYLVGTFIIEFMEVSRII